MDNNMVVMNLVVSSGEARSMAIEALRAAKNGDFDSADRLMKEADAAVLAAHELQTGMIQAEVKGSRQEMTLLMVHAQDHLMNALTVMDLTRELIDILRGKQG